MSQEKQTHAQRSIAARATAAERYSRIAKDPTTPWLIGKLAALEAWKQKPRGFEIRMADNAVARLDSAEARKQAAHEQLIASVGALQRIRAGEPRIVPPSEEVASFALEIAEMDNQATQPPQTPEHPEQQ